MCKFRSVAPHPPSCCLLSADKRQSSKKTRVCAIPVKRWWAHNKKYEAASETQEPTWKTSDLTKPKKVTIGPPRFWAVLWIFKEPSIPPRPGPSHIPLRFLNSSVSVFEKPKGTKESSVPFISTALSNWWFSSKNYYFVGRFFDFIIFLRLILMYQDYFFFFLLKIDG